MSHLLNKGERAFCSRPSPFCPHQRSGKECTHIWRIVPSVLRRFLVMAPKWNVILVSIHQVVINLFVYHTGLVLLGQRPVGCVIDRRPQSVDILFSGLILKAVDKHLCRLSQLFFQCSNPSVIIRKRFDECCSLVFLSLRMIVFPFLYGGIAHVLITFESVLCKYVIFDITVSESFLYECTDGKCDRVLIIVFEYFQLRIVFSLQVCCLFVEIVVFCNLDAIFS